MIVKAKLLGPKNERRVVGWDGIALRRIREGDEFEIPDDVIEVAEVINGTPTGNKIMQPKYFSPQWMEKVEQIPKPVTQTPQPIVSDGSLEVVKRRGRKPAQKQSSGDIEVI